MKIAGIDLSINSPGKCIMDLDDNTLDIRSIKFYGFNTIKKRCLKQDNVEIDHVGSDYVKKNMFERQDLAYKILMKDMEEVKFAAMEGYSYSSAKSNSLFQIGEFSGGFKKIIYDMHKGLVIYAPSVVKLFSTGMGNAQKNNMKQAFVSQYPQYYPPCIEGLPQFDSPASDIVDAFWITTILRYHIAFEKNPELVPGDIMLKLSKKSSKKVSSILETKMFKKSVK
jgi:Holliday junction resolvasome RuvABC endonuclease subunit